MGLTLQALSEVAHAVLRGDPGRVITRVATLQDAGEGAISFLANPRYKPQLASTSASAVILSAADAADCPVDCLVSDNPYLAHAQVMNALYPAAKAVPGVHDTAYVDASARVAASAEIAANCYLGAGVVIEEGVAIGPGCVLLDNVHVDADSRLIASVTLGADTQLGKRCLIHPGAVIGSDGFGMANDQGAWIKVPQIGRVILGDDVEIGACSTLDRGALGDTVIADGVKIDNQVHVAHNVWIGEHTAIAAGTAIAGSVHIGSYCTLAGQSGVVGHVTLADHVHISGATGVTRSIREPGVYTGMIPAMDHASWLKNFARLRHLDDMVQRIKALEQALADKRERDDADG